jgi:hypothetical protein
MSVEPQSILAGPFIVLRHADGVLAVHHRHELGTDRMVISPENARLLIDVLTRLTVVRDH